VKTGRAIFLSEKLDGRYFLMENWTGDIFKGKAGRAIFLREKLDGRQFIVRKTGRATNFCQKNWTGDKFLSEKLDGRQKNLGDPEIPPVLFLQYCLFCFLQVLFSLRFL